MENGKPPRLPFVAKTWNDFFGFIQRKMATTRKALPTAEGRSELNDHHFQPSDAVDNETSTLIIVHMIGLQFG